MKPFSLNIKGTLREFDRPAIMGVVNATPDSFYDASRTMAAAEAAARAAKLHAAGASMIDVGGCSTRPGAKPVGEQEELDRLAEVLPAVRRAVPDAIVSVDTFRARVARIAVDELGADMVNDVSGGNIDPDMHDTVAELGVPYVLTHSRGDVSDMMEYTDYEMVTRDVLAELGDRLQQLALLGVADVIVDPGFGFSKTTEQNYQLLADLEVFGLLHRPVLVGMSRKSMITNVLGIAADEALCATTALNTMALERGAAILRVHDPAQAQQAILIYQKLQSCHRSE